MAYKSTKQRRAARRRRVVQSLGPGYWLIVNKQIRTEVVEYGLGESRPGAFGETCGDYEPVEAEF